MSDPTAAAAGAAADVSPDGRVVAPALVRRLAAFLYESVLLFGVLFTLNLVYFGFTHQSDPSLTHAPLMGLSFLVLGAYFIYFWTHGGQTLAQKTWHLRVVTDVGQPLPPRRALMRYIASWVWVLPPFVLIVALGLPKSRGLYFGAPLVWIVGYAASSLLHPRRQFWHDALCGTAIGNKQPTAPLPQ